MTPLNPRNMSFEHTGMTGRAPCVKTYPGRYYSAFHMVSFNSSIEGTRIRFFGRLVIGHSIAKTNLFSNSMG